MFKDVRQSGGMERREFLKWAGGYAFSVTASGLLAGCSTGSTVAEIGGTNQQGSANGRIVTATSPLTVYRDNRGGGFVSSVSCLL